MPYIKKGAQTEIGRKIEMLAERLPYKEWYLPDPYNPTSYIMPIGLGKIGKAGGRLFEVVFKRSSTGRVLPTIPFEIASSAHPEKLKTFLNYVERQFPDAVPNQRVKFPIDSISRSVGSAEKGMLNALFKGWDKK
jgi:hypothetical protein